MIARPISGTEFYDLMGPYPIFCCKNWARLGESLEPLRENYVSVTLVTDPFADLSSKGVATVFDVFRPLHEHYIVELDSDTPPSNHHRRRLRRSGNVEIRIAKSDPDFLPHWLDLYEVLCARRNISGIRAFTRESFEKQLSVPGGYIISAWNGGALLGADWYFQHDSIVFAHLSAYAEVGYKQAISYPLMNEAIQYFRGRAEFLDLGGAPPGAAGQGTAFFKSGWASATKKSYLCGGILEKTSYAHLCRPNTETSYFPPYRFGEFSEP